jgi:hypothetical protein
MALSFKVRLYLIPTPKEFIAFPINTLYLIRAVLLVIVLAIRMSLKKDIIG